MVLSLPFLKQEQLQESEEHYALLLQKEHSKREACERQYAVAMREVEARLAEASLAEEYFKA